MPELTFPHGNVDLVVDRDAKRVRFSCDVEGNETGFEPCRLLYPVREKNYSDDPFVADQWARAKDFLERAYYVTVFGYSAPKTDVEARRLLLDAWTSNRTMMLGQFDVVDIAEKTKLKEAWGEFIVKTHGGYLDNVMHTFPKRNPRRTCENFGFMTLQSQPRHNDPFPELTDLGDLERWIAPLIAEEGTGRLSGEPLHYSASK